MRSTRALILVSCVLALAACGAQPGPQTAGSDAEAVAPAAAAPELATGLDAYEAMEQAALAGDYQAQRNLAYTLTYDIPHNPILGCAWRIVIVESGDPQVDQSDTSNRKHDCDKLGADEQAAAQAQAKKLQEQLAAK